VVVAPDPEIAGPRDDADGLIDWGGRSGVDDHLARLGRVHDPDRGRTHRDDAARRRAKKREERRGTDGGDGRARQAETLLGGGIFG
jgi:hypothetical protein